MEQAVQQTLYDLAEQREHSDAVREDSVREELKLLSKEARPQHRIIGQLFDTYWLVEFQDQFYMIDQHAAHEKVLFEQTMKHTTQRIYVSDGKPADHFIPDDAGRNFIKEIFTGIYETGI